MPRRTPRPAPIQAPEYAQPTWPDDPRVAMPVPEGTWVNGALAWRGRNSIEKTEFGNHAHLGTRVEIVMFKTNNKPPKGQDPRALAAHHIQIAEFLDAAADAGFTWRAKHGGTYAIGALVHQPWIDTVTAHAAPVDHALVNAGFAKPLWLEQNSAPWEQSLLHSVLVDLGWTPEAIVAFLSAVPKAKANWASGPQPIVQTDALAHLVALTGLQPPAVLAWTAALAPGAGQARKHGGPAVENWYRAHSDASPRCKSNAYGTLRTPEAACRPCRTGSPLTAFIAIHAPLAATLEAIPQVALSLGATYGATASGEEVAAWVAELGVPAAVERLLTLAALHQAA